VSVPDVLVVGAGPAGLATALQAQANGAEVRVVDRRPDAGRPSRAMVVHPRTLENLRVLGVTDELMERADTRPRAELHLGGRCVSVSMQELALPDTAFPHLTLVRQRDVEEVLAGTLARRGVHVERGVELTALAQASSRPVRAVLRSEDRTEQVEARFLAGCDGQASTVRRLAGISWRGAPYREEVVLADVELDGGLDPGVLHAVAGRDGLVFVFALGEGASWRVLATRPLGDAGPLAFGQPGPPVPVQQVQRLLDEAGLPATVAAMPWSARVPLQHRLAGSFRSGGLFLAGDAAHAQSPAGAQGMNTGIQDAVNLGWKLAYAARSGHVDPLLASYDAERRPAARLVLAMTHLIFFAEASSHPAARLLRGRLVPLGAPALPLLLGQRRLLAEGVRVLGQMRFGYRHSPLSCEAAPRSRLGARPGDRLPDGDVRCDGTTRRLHDLTARPGMHVLLARDAVELPSWQGISVHRLTDRAGRDALVVRPDGVVGYRSGEADTVELAGWLRLAGALS